ncbi:hypothetical protein AeMF1_006638 [Aphanomyces euteiches]|nr:hypothetical protein AeMF1_006638 [Aphanomyces euteiches]KAH9184919.1 hypothetical protein AeNC1_013106 [Aphanomyces euteiches]
MPSARKVSSYFTFLGNLTLKTRLTPLKTDKFEAIWFGDALNDASDANMLYIHGGGFVWCHAETNAQGVVGMVSNAKSQYGKTLVALGLDYKLAPEAKFPSQLHEALAAYEYLTTRSSKPILLLGDSAGGNLKTSICAVLLQLSQCQLDFSNIAPSYTKNQKSDYCGAGRLSHYVDGYVGSASVKDPLVSPIRGDFRGCCPILIHYGGKEVFQDDIEALVGVLKEQQVDVTAVKNPLAPHDTPMMPALFGDMALSGGQVIAAFLAKHA